MTTLRQWLEDDYDQVSLFSEDLEYMAKSLGLNYKFKHKYDTLGEYDSIQENLKGCLILNMFVNKFGVDKEIGVKL